MIPSLRVTRSSTMFGNQFHALLFWYLALVPVKSITCSVALLAMSAALSNGQFLSLVWMLNGSGI